MFLARLTVTALLVASACTPITSAPPALKSPSPTPTPTSSPTDKELKDLGSALCAPSSGGSEGALVNLVDVRLGGHDSFDRVTLEFAEADSGAAEIPSYRIETTEPPFAYSPSGADMEVEGNDFAALHMQGVTRMGSDGSDTYGGPTEMTPGLNALTELEMQGDFEATMDWILGTDKRTCWRVFELEDPLRLVIDLPH